MIEEKYMRMALRLATYGAGTVSPNPMVGAVIVAPDGRIIGRGWHRRWGGPHAEVNAVRSVSAADRPLLPDSTIYVTLEPCSHYGKTPPCSLLLIQERLRHVVVGSPDPFPLVSGRGIRMLRDAGIEVTENFMQKECDFLNRRFITAHTLRRPYILLKWAQSADCRMARYGHDGSPLPVRLSSPVGSVLMHRQRALYDAIIVGTQTVLSDNPELSTRLWAGSSPRPVTFESPRIPADARIRRDGLILLEPHTPLLPQMERLYNEGITSLMVEGGPSLLASFIGEDLCDEIRIETAPVKIGDGPLAPALPQGWIRFKDIATQGNTIAGFMAPRFCGLIPDEAIFYS